LTEREFTKILDWPGYRVYRYEIDELARILRLWVRRKRGNRGFICSGCGGRCTKIAEIRQREVRDLPWRKYQTFVVIEFYRVHCPKCGLKVETVPQLPSKAPFSKDFEDAVGLACESAAARQVARQFGLAAGTVAAPWRQIDMPKTQAVTLGRIHSKAGVLGRRGRNMDMATGMALRSARTGIAAVAFAAALWGQADLFRFSFDQDGLGGEADFSYLNHALTQADRVFVKGGHFHTVGRDLMPNTPDDERVRFFGVNLAFGANFPTGDDATRIARRLRRLGVNLVRLHHMDSSPDPSGNPANANSTLLDGPYPTFNEVSVARLRDFLTALAAEGIYADVNLHVGYQFRPAVDGVPAIPGQSMPTQSKPLHIFYPKMVKLQQDYARGLIERLQLRDDPALALVEINNESSLLHEWNNGQLDPVLAGEYRAALQSQWNQWLAAKYGSTDALAKAWGGGTAAGAELLSGKWTLEQGHGKTGVLTTVQIDGFPTAQVQPGSGSGWLFLKQTGFHLSAGVRYVWTFEARADVAAGQTVNAPTSIMRDVSPWDGMSSPSVTLTSQWQTYTRAVTAAFNIQDSGRVSLDVEYAPGNVYVRKMSLKQAELRGLAEGESLEAANISLLAPTEGATAARMADYTAFIIATDRAYVNALRDTVRAGTSALVPITGTQMGYGGLGILDSQDGLDYQDNHFYVDHYSFPNTSWDGLDWRIRDTGAADAGWSSFLDMAWARPAGQPYTVSEFNQPWPNTHGAELDPALAAFAAFQDWDGIMHFAYSHGRNWDDGVPNGFNINGDWTKFGVVGQSAWLFRTGAVRPGETPLTAPVSAAQRLAAAQSGQSPSAWVVKAGIPKDAAFTARVELMKDGAGPLPTPAAAAAGELSFNAASKMLALNAPKAAGAFGRLGAGKFTIGPIDVELASGAAAVLLTARDDLPIPYSHSLLLSVPGYALRALPAAGNHAPVALSAVPQTLKNYQGAADWWTLDPTNSANAAKPSGDMNGGWQPTYMQRVEAWLTLRTKAQRISVYPLDGSGRLAAALPASEIQSVDGGFRVHVNGAGQQASPWFVIHAAQPARGLGRRPPL
jgi:hypothetical protein